MTEFAPRLLRALGAQLRERDATLRAGADRIGWKLGMGDRERIDGAIAVGHLTSRTVVPNAGSYIPPAGADLFADAEAFVEFGSSGAISRFGGALEIVDLAPVPGEPETVVARNVFHLAVSFVELAEAPHPGLPVRIQVDGAVLDEGRWPADIGERLTAAAELLAAVNECLQPGDRVITGSIVQVPVAGSEVVATFGDLAAARLTIERGFTD